MYGTPVSVKNIGSGWTGRGINQDASGMKSALKG